MNNLSSKMTSGKNIVITGASKGLGKELALRLSKKNHNMVLVARNKAGLESVQKEICILTGKSPLIISCDVSIEGDLRNLAEIITKKYQHIDVLINNAGIGIFKLFKNMRIEEIKSQFETNCFGVFYLIKALLPLLEAGSSSYILNIGSLLGKVSFPETSIYSASKFAMYGFTEGFRYEIKRRNIKVGLFLPGHMNTSFHNNREEETFKAPGLLTLDPRQAAAVVERMINKRKNNVYMYRWMLWLMKIKQYFEN